MIFNRLASCLLLALPALAAPAPQATTTSTTSSSGYWLPTVLSQGLGSSPFQGNTTYTIYRNVKDYGAVGDGTTDDTAAINAAISAGGRCGLDCQSSTVTPAVVYFPAGTYLVSTPVIQYYFTQLIGDATNPPTLKASAAFTGMAVIDSDPYEDDGSNWWVNQNNFFRQVRNFEIDITAQPVTEGACIHWQVAQATSLQNIVFTMRTDGGTTNMQKGIFMDNGSGGFMSDLTFNGGGIGAFLGNQQFTTRNLTFNGCQTAIYMNWNWAWTLKDVTIDSCTVGLDMANGASSQTVGSVLFLDSKISNTQLGVNTSYLTTESSTNGTLIIDNVDMSTNVDIAIKDAMSGSTVLAGNQVVSNFVQGNSYQSGSGLAVQKAIASNTTKPASLLNSDGTVFTRSKPQYETLDASSFVSVKANGAKGDGSTDDTAAIQAILNNATDGQVIFFDHGAYVVTDTIKVPGTKNIKMTGEVWPMIMAKGTSFNDMSNPKPVFQVGEPGDEGAVEMSDMVFETLGAAPGAIMIEWNMKGSSNGAAGMWDVHARIGGSAGTELLSAQCAKNPNVTHSANAACEGAFMLMHITESASNVYLENTWFWVADHDLELGADSQQIDIYNGRGVLIESSGPVWMYGTAAEHSQLYNYQVNNASAIYMSLIQTETAYMQGNPNATTPFPTNATYNDPSFASCTEANCARTWGLRIVNSDDVYVYGAGLYSFFDNYEQTCLETESCQQNMVSIESSAAHIFGLSTKASVNMLTVDGESKALDSDNRNTYCATLSYFASSA
ncbi:family 55 glycoside hydrolase [Cryphonectria parasitica EP155]|uniref:Family 55 glycoside hydrolase n=1 Tax=Cryphonectria parasitica (strain ATCC 38755 / EP155) TaxID=660469 RepID=A0A9P4YAW7_CRYP1|nr:family 55 glycoside hydrolase [Cryphonectria parasitica EP155]KAF3769527.1 family 55 glycoside hydrolase [Cryphonectria parasitica EP155]